MGVRDGVVLAIHGGAHHPARAHDARLDREYRKAIAGALLAGHQVLAEGGRAEEAVVAAIRPLEDSPLFNAGAAPCSATTARWNSTRRSCSAAAGWPERWPG